MLRSKLSLRYAGWILGYTALFAVVYAAMYALGWVTQLPTAGGLVSGDARFYHSIRLGGYEYLPGVACNAGFFPLFSYLWRLTGLGVVGISILNGIVFLCATWINCLFLRPPPVVLGLFLSLPFLFYCYTPHSEAFFFLFATGVIWSFARRRYNLLFVSLLLAGLTRPTFFFLIPALVGVTLMERPLRQVFTLPPWRTLLLYCVLPTVISFLAVAYVQYVQVGEAFAYFKVQAEVWGREFGWPVLPLAGRADTWLLRWRLINYCVGVLAALFGLRYLIGWLSGRALPAALGRPELLSVIYLTMALCSILLFNPEWHWVAAYGYSSTVLNGINRYVQVNPFLLVFLVYLFGWRSPSLRAWGILLIVLHVVYLIAWPQYYTHIQKYLQLCVITGILAAYAVYHRWRWAPLGFGLVIASFAQQAYMFSELLSGTPVD